jgi:hypothetical protein
MPMKPMITPPRTDDDFARSTPEDSTADPAAGAASEPRDGA